MHTECCAAALMHSTCFRFMASTEMKLESSSRYDVGVMYTWRLRNGTHSTYKYYTIPHITHNIYSQQIRTTLVRDEFESCWWVKHLMHKLYWYQVVTWNTQSSDCLTAPTKKIQARACSFPETVGKHAPRSCASPETNAQGCNTERTKNMK